MPRILFIFLLSLATLLHADARTPMRGWLTAMPNTVLPLLTENDRLDLIDFHDARMEAVVTNQMDGKSRLDTLTEDFACIQYTRSTEVAMKLLPVNDTTDILCMVTTMKANVSDSRITFFDAGWRPVDVATCLDEPCMEDFRTTALCDSAEWAWSKVNTFFRTYHLCAENTDLRCILTTLDHLSKEDRAEVAPYVRREPLTYGWTNGKFVRHEQ